MGHADGDKQETLSGELMVIIRIFCGWAGIYLMAKGVPPELAHLMTGDPQVVGMLTGMLGEAIGLLLAAGQLIWWRIAKLRKWTT